MIAEQCIGWLHDMAGVSPLKPIYPKRPNTTIVVRAELLYVHSQPCSQRRLCCRRSQSKHQKHRLRRPVPVFVYFSDGYVEVCLLVLDFMVWVHANINPRELTCCTCAHTRCGMRVGKHRQRRQQSRAFVCVCVFVCEFVFVCVCVCVCV